MARSLGHRARRPVRASGGGGFSVIATTCATSASATGALPGGGVLSRKSPSAPACMTRACRRQTIAAAWRASHLATVATETPIALAIRRGFSPACRRETIKARILGVVLAFW